MQLHAMAAEHAALQRTLEELSLGGQQVMELTLKQSSNHRLSLAALWSMLDRYACVVPQCT